jgi:hypothetical protein
LEEKNKKSSFRADDWPCSPCNGAEKLPCTKEAARHRGKQGGTACMVSRPCKLDEGRVGEGAVERRVHVHPLPAEPLQSGVAEAQGQVGLLLRRRDCKA